jgi:hypothetical protein
MKIDLDLLEYRFLHKPLLIGGKAMEYYDLRLAGADVDFVVRNDDHANLVAKYPGHVRNVYGDIGVCVDGFELWNRILLFPYEFLSLAAREEDNFLVVSLERLLFLKTLAISVEKNGRDVRLIVRKINAIQYGKDGRFGADHFIGSIRG